MATVRSAQVAKLVEASLGRPVGPEENFFEAGFDSLGLVRLHEEICAELGVELPETTLFTHANLRALTEYLENPDQPAGAERGMTGAADRRTRVTRSRRDARARARRDGGAGR
ncbi:acyl carrier protein [Bailinhaonella thermotolerans]|nr:acyl carrier protein [Bailinhaonella thermotolerans]